MGVRAAKPVASDHRAALRAPKRASVALHAAEGLLFPGCSSSTTAGSLRSSGCPTLHFAFMHLSSSEQPPRTLQQLHPLTCSSNLVMTAWTHSTGLCAAMLRRVPVPLPARPGSAQPRSACQTAPRHPQTLQAENRETERGSVLHSQPSPPRRHDTPPEV